MLICKFRVDGSSCSTEQYAGDPDKYRGLIDCSECGEKAWFVKGYSTGKIERMACFGARHKEGCNASTVLLRPEGINEAETEGDLTSDIRVDLDKVTSNSIFVSQDNDKHGQTESTRMSSKAIQGTGGDSGLPLNKSLRALLTNLCRNPHYADKGQSIHIVSDGGRDVIKGLLADYLVPISEASEAHIGREYIFWGPINNLNIDKSGTLWLNYGDYRTEPSIGFDSRLKEQVIQNFKIKDVSDLDGCDVIIVGHLGISRNNKVVITTGFTKYMSFRKMNVVEENDDHDDRHIVT